MFMSTLIWRYMDTKEWETQRILNLKCDKLDYIPKTHTRFIFYILKFSASHFRLYSCVNINLMQWNPKGQNYFSCQSINISWKIMNDYSNHFKTTDQYWKNKDLFSIIDQYILQKKSSDFTLLNCAALKLEWVGGIEIVWNRNEKKQWKKTIWKEGCLEPCQS